MLLHLSYQYILLFTTRPIFKMLIFLQIYYFYIEWIRVLHIYLDHNETIKSSFFSLIFSAYFNIIYAYFKLLCWIFAYLDAYYNVVEFILQCIIRG